MSEAMEMYEWVESVIEDLIKEYESKEQKFAEDVGAINALRELLRRLNEDEF